MVNKQRRDSLKVSESVEMYIETIYLLEKDHGHAHVVDIANKLGISKAGVTKATKKMAEMGLIHKEEYGSICLTHDGKLLAERVYYYHKVITLFLKMTLNISDEEASENACKMEHILSKNILVEMIRYLRNNGVNIGDLK